MGKVTGTWLVLCTDIMIYELIRDCKRRKFQSPRMSALIYAEQKAGISQLCLPLAKS